MNVRVFSFFGRSKISPGAFLVHDPIVHVENPMGDIPGEFHLVGYNGHGQSAGRQAPMTPSTSLTIVGSRAEVGSSNRMTPDTWRGSGDGHPLLCPPESSSGNASALAASPPARAAPGRAFPPLPGFSSGADGPNGQVVQDREVLEQVEILEDHPIFRRRASGSFLGSRMSSPLIQIRPPDDARAVSGSAETCFSRAEGPMMDMTSPFLISMLTSFKTAVSRRPWTGC